MNKISVDEFCNFKFLSNIEFSPDGSRCCFVVTSADKEKNCYNSNIYVREGETVKQLTSGNKERSFIFLDNDTLLFPGNREGAEDKAPTSYFYRISLSGGEAVKAFTFPIPVSRLIPLKNGDFIAEGKTYPGFEDLYKGDAELTEKYKKHLEDNKDYEVIEQFPWWSNGGTFSRGAYSSIFYYETKENKLTRLTGAGFSASNPKLAPDGETVFFQGGNVAPITQGFKDRSLYRIDLKTREQHLVVEGTDEFSLRSYEFGDSFILIAASNGSCGLNTDPDFYKMSYGTYEIEPYAKYGYSIGSSIGSDVRYGGGRTLKMVGDTCYFITTRFDSSYLYKLEDGVISPVTEKDGSVDCFDICGDKIIFSALYDMKAQELYDETGNQLTSFNVEVLKDKYVAVPEVLNFARDGHQVHGFVLKPIDFVPGEKYPVIIDIHGGPKTAYGPVFYHEMQYWTSLGYFVIYCNPTGSDGRGSFADIRGKYGTVDYDDIMAFCDEALKVYPEMDEYNFFETGGSYGGFMTNWIIGHTDRLATGF